MNQTKLVNKRSINNPEERKISKADYLIRSRSLLTKILYVVFLV